MFSTPGSSGVHVVSIGDSKGVKRLRVNVIYERRSGAGSSPVAEEVDSPPQIDFEGYGDEIPEWGGIEQEVSSGHANWNEDDIGDGVPGVLYAKVAAIGRPYVFVLGNETQTRIAVQRCLFQ
ncbi:unnamed protein product [Nippostrongylus brasiliensis]|uniref:Velvet domain-containing protein n=1 Tax=Nippostrongylus brasiliensis TaxID=27835 RepID=A0A0N4YJ10_NIPBR|nr:unnamed protein product [Nippostrongylus brasiliensis]